MFGFLFRRRKPAPPSPLIGAVAYMRQILPTADALSMQKLLYLAQMIHLGRHKEPIFEENFKATMLGPIIPSLQPILKSRTALIRQGHHQDTLTPKAKALIQEIVTRFGSMSGGDLVSITHRNEGAWARNYATAPRGCENHYYGRIISNDDLIADYLHLIS